MNNIDTFISSIPDLILRYKNYIFILLLGLCTCDLHSQSIFTGRQYVGEGIPLRWFKLETDTTGVYFSKGDVGHTVLDTTQLRWQQKTDSTIQLLLYYENVPDTYNLIMNLDKREFWYTEDYLDIFHRRTRIEYDGVIFEE